MNIGIDHGYHAIKTRNFSFPAGVTAYSHEPYTLQNTLQYGGKFYVCGTGRQPILRNKMENDNYYLLTLAAIAREIQHRNAKTECSVTIAAGLPLTSFGRDKKAFREYLFRSGQAVRFRYEGIFYRITIENVKLFPQGYSALAVHPELLRDEPSVLLMDIGGWTVDLMRLDNGVPNAATCRSLELGMIRCMEEAREQVLREKGVSVTDAQIERVLSGKNCSLESSIQYKPDGVPLSGRPGHRHGTPRKLPAGVPQQRRRKRRCHHSAGTRKLCGRSPLADFSER